MTVRTALPEPGRYSNGTATYELRHTSAGDWYALKVKPDGSKVYVSQRVILSTLTGPASDTSSIANDSISLVKAAFQHT